MARQLEGGHAHLAEMVQAVKNHGAGALHFASGCKMAEVCEYLLRLSRWTWMLLTKQVCLCKLMLVFFALFRF